MLREKIRHEDSRKGLLLNCKRMGNEDKPCVGHRPSQLLLVIKILVAACDQPHDYLKLRICRHNQQAILVSGPVQGRRFRTVASSPGDAGTCVTA